MVKKVLIALVVIVAGFLIFAATRPDTVKVERSTTIAASPEIVFAMVNDFHHWADWSPWEKLDPAMKKTFDGSPAGVGSSYAWVGNDKVGEGKMSITESKAPNHVAIALEFIKPFSMKSTVDFDIAAAPQGTNVKWDSIAQQGLMGKAMGIFMDMDKMIGPDYEKGLTQMKTLAEAEAKKQEEAKKAAEAAAPAPAAAATP